MNRDFIEKLDAAINFKADPAGPQTLIESGFNTVEDESAIVNGFAMLIEPAFARKLCDLSESMERCGDDLWAIPYVPLRPSALAGVSMFGVEGEFGKPSAKAASHATYDTLLEDADRNGLMVSGICEIQVTKTDIIIQVMGNEEGMCEAAFTRDKFMEIVNSPFDCLKAKLDALKA